MLSTRIIMWTFQYEIFAIRKQTDSDFITTWPDRLSRFCCNVSSGFRGRSADALVRAKVLNNCDVHSVIVARLWLLQAKLRIAHPRLQTPCAREVRFLDRPIGAINVEDNKEKTNFSAYSPDSKEERQSRKSIIWRELV